MAELLSKADLAPAGVVHWRERVPDRHPGIYLVALTDSATAVEGTLEEAPISMEAIRAWLAVRPELRLDGIRPSESQLARRIAEFWFPGETVLYIGLTTRPLRRRVDEYYKTPLGARRPHAGGHFIKTLVNLDQLFVHFAPCEAPAQAEDAMLRTFCDSVSPESRNRLRDSVHLFPFANLEWPRGTRKVHGLTGTKEPRVASRR